MRVKYSVLYVRPLCRYVGEIISDAEADVREIDSYLFSLDSKVRARLKRISLIGFSDISVKGLLVYIHLLCIFPKVWKCGNGEGVQVL